MTAFARYLVGGGLLQRVVRTSAITLFGFGAQQGLRFASNLLLTRLLFPEAFGTVAAIHTLVYGLIMLTDTGLHQAIITSKRGDDPGFLGTAWSVQLGRGVLLYLAGLLLVGPVAAYYQAPDLATYLPVALLVLVIDAMRPIRYHSAFRHMQAGRLMVLDLSGNVAGIGAMVLMAWATGSIWALVLGSLVTPTVQAVLQHLYLPGPRPGIRWESAALGELFRFGRWVAPSSICGFAAANADKIVLGRWLGLTAFGVYNIGFFIASFPAMLAAAVVGRVLLPVYRESPPGESAATFRRTRRLRLALQAALIGPSLLLAVVGPWIIALLYDARYQGAQGMVVLIAVAQITTAPGTTADQVPLTAGDSRGFFLLVLTRSVLAILGLLLGLGLYGLGGGILFGGLAMLASYPVLAWTLSRHGAWDPKLDLSMLGLGLLGGAGAILWHRDLVAPLFG